MVNKIVYTSSIENIDKLPVNCIAIVISKNTSKLNKKALYSKRIKVKVAAKLLPTKDIIMEYKKSKDFELFHAAYTYYLLNEQSDILDKIFSCIMNTKKKVIILTKGKRINKNSRKVIGNILYRRYKINWQEYKENDSMSDFDKYVNGGK